MSFLFSAMTVVAMIAILLFLIALIPDSTLPTTWHDAVVNMATYVKAWGFFVDFNVLMSTVIFIMACEAVILFFKLFMRLYAYILTRVS